MLQMKKKYSKYFICIFGFLFAMRLFEFSAIIPEYAMKLLLFQMKILTPQFIDK